MSLALNKIILANATANTPGAYFQLANISATTAGNVIPAGTYLIPGTSNVFITVVTAVNATTGNATAVSNLLAINTGGVVISDGVNVFANATTNVANVTVLTIDGGQNVSGTYNNV
jgi:hypothetical protein